jgi:hypothetical protein
MEFARMSFIEAVGTTEKDRRRRREEEGSVCLSSHSGLVTWLISTMRRIQLAD